MKKIKKILLGLLIFVLLLFVGLTIYASNPYHPLQEMDDSINSLDTSNITIIDKNRSIQYIVDNPKKQIVFIPGGLVEPKSYEYLAVKLALAGYNVTIFKPFYDLAILTPNYAKMYLSDTLDNVVIGHSLGGVVASQLSSKNDLVSTVILLGSYPIKDLTDKKVLLITAEHDINMDQDKFNESFKYLNDEAVHTNIVGGNHAQFGWYGPQKGDGEAEIDTLSQQDLTVDLILDFIK